MRIYAIGIDLAAGRGVTELATLSFDLASDAPPAWLTDAYCATHDDAALLATVADALRLGDLRVIAIDAPLSLPAAVVAALCGDTPGDGASPSPYTRAAERDPYWRSVGIRPLPISFLGGLTFRALTLVPRLRALAPGATIIEVFPSATLAALRPNNPSTQAESSRRDGAARRPKRRRQAKTTPASRAANQALLAHWIDGLPMLTLSDTQAPQAQQPLGADLLDALAAALTGVFYARGRYRAIGDPLEGQIVLPQPQ